MTSKEFYKDYFSHTSQHVSIDKIFVCMELYAKEYANKRVIEELEARLSIKGNDCANHICSKIQDRIKELKQ